MKTKPPKTPNNPSFSQSLPGMRIGLVVPHIFMHRDILPSVIFSPGNLALDLAVAMQQQGAKVSLFTPGPVGTTVNNQTTDLHGFETELAARGDTYIELLKKHPLVFITLARQVQSELIAKAYAAANNNDLDLIHIYTNEEDIALPFAQFCRKPVVFTHHDPFNFLVKYKHVFPKYRQLNWLSVSYSQRRTMPPDTNWLANIYHGLDESVFKPNYHPGTRPSYLAFLGRIIESKGVHLAIEAVRLYNQQAAEPLKLKIAGKHYAGTQKDTYWQEKVAPLIDNQTVEYVGHLKTTEEKQQFLGHAQALMVPSIFNEPFGMVMIEALACGTPVIGLASGAIPEVIDDGETGVVVPIHQKQILVHSKPEMVVDEDKTSQALAQAIPQALHLDRNKCRKAFEANFTLSRMAQEHLAAYRKLLDEAQPTK